MLETTSENSSDSSSSSSEELSQQAEVKPKQIAIARANDLSHRVHQDVSAPSAASNMLIH